MAHPASDPTSLEQIAREIIEEWSEYKGGSFSGSDLWSLIRSISAFALTVQKQERERCAKIADVIASIHSDPSRIQTAERIASAIRQGDDNAS